MENLLIAIGPAFMTGLFGVIMWRLQKSDNDRKVRHDKTDALLETVKINTTRIDQTEDLLGELRSIAKELKESSDANSDGVKLLMRYMLQRYHGEYKLRGYITSKELDEFLEAFAVYEAKGGNGTAKLWKKEVESLPVRDDLPIENAYIRILKGEKHGEN